MKELLLFNLMAYEWGGFSLNQVTAPEVVFIELMVPLSYGRPVLMVYFFTNLAIFSAGSSFIGKFIR
ncbi:hypothetical protein FZC78_18855 [Rossellomorea vietnamensis]|uniref:Uncharacterized protein n=1 Tax=Rossellomorea vietnamensis TaxID=218284 RepID=A0A5D4NKY6_9BACI|nr:hypothetical protein [Rossellomorea vietnamensis]TYS14539.1 hypothetical protein FZC78_18855 [Rossellomorea vietnamensis]